MSFTGDVTNHEGPRRTTSALLTSTLDRVKGSPSYGKALEEFLLIPPRKAAQMGSYLFSSVPQQLQKIVGSSGSVIAEATGRAPSNTTVIASTSNLTAFTLTEGSGSSSSTQGLTWIGTLSFQNFKSMGGFFAYAFSKWALTCFTMVSYSKSIR